jgi:hypothetical protein
MLISSLSIAGSTRTLKRTEDYIILTGGNVPSLNRCETGDLHLYAYGPAGFGAAPFQVDKRDAGGLLVFPDEPDPLRDGTRLDPNDELVFMIRDAGNRSPRGARVEGAFKGVEIELVDPLDGGKAWVYLFERPGRDPPDTADYVGQYEDDERVFALADQYEVGQPKKKYYYDWLKLRKPDGSWGADLFDRQKMGMKALLLNGSIPIAIPEQEVQSRTLGVIDGPVRLVRREMRLAEIRIIGFKYITEFNNYFYGNGYVSPVEIEIPVTMYKLFMELSFYYGMDFTEAAIGSVVKNPANPGGIKLDGKPDPGVDDKSDTLYMTFTGPEGSFIEVFALDENLSQMLDRATYIEEDLSKTDPDEDHPGSLVAGFYTASGSRLKKGVYSYAIYHYYPGSVSGRKTKEILNMIEHPVKIETRPIATPSEPAPAN